MPAYRPRGFTLVEERQRAQRLLDGLESGRLSTTDAVFLAEEIDPVLFYVIVSYLRAIHPASDPVATSVLERVVRLTSASAVLVRRHREGGEDSVASWFESEHSYGDFRGRGEALIAVVADKLDS